MIVMLLFHPVAFVLTVALWSGVLLGADQIGYDPMHDGIASWVAVAGMVASYLLLSRFLPRWTNLWYHLNARKRHELMWGKDSASERYDRPYEPLYPVEKKK